jgi:SPP1 gp7 family putative phage head morphogenesis protein
VLVEEFGFARSRAKLIARDQTSKFNGSLNRIRQQQAGITEYRWSTSHDERVRGNPDGKYPNARPSHWAREDKVFAWDKPPSDGHPGEPINCRCVALAVLN